MNSTDQSVIDAMQRDLADLRRALWLVIRAAGGSVTITDAALADFKPERCSLVVDVDAINRRRMIRAKLDTDAPNVSREEPKRRLVILSRRHDQAVEWASAHRVRLSGAGCAIIIPSTADPRGERSRGLSHFDFVLLDGYSIDALARVRIRPGAREVDAETLQPVPCECWPASSEGCSQCVD